MPWLWPLQPILSATIPAAGRMGIVTGSGARNTREPRLANPDGGGTPIIPSAETAAWRKMTALRTRPARPLGARAGGAAAVMTTRDRLSDAGVREGCSASCLPLSQSPHAIRSANRQITLAPHVRGASTSSAPLRLSATAKHDCKGQCLTVAKLRDGMSGNRKSGRKARDHEMGHPNQRSNIRFRLPHLSSQ